MPMMYLYYGDYHINNFHVQRDNAPTRRTAGLLETRKFNSNILLTS